MIDFINASQKYWDIWKAFDFRWESLLSEVKLSILKKKTNTLGLKLSIYLRDIFTFDLEKREHQVFVAIWDGIF